LFLPLAETGSLEVAAINKKDHNHDTQLADQSDL